MLLFPCNRFRAARRLESGWAGSIVDSAHRSGLWLISSGCDRRRILRDFRRSLRGPPNDLHAAGLR